MAHAISTPSGNSDLVNIKYLSSLVVNGDFTPAVAAAIAAIKANGYGGIYFPGDASPYRFALAASGHANIELNGITTPIRIQGDGDATKLQQFGSGGGQSWQIISADGCSQVEIDSLWIDGNAANLTGVDAAHTCLIRAGNSSSTGTLSELTVKNCKLSGSYGDCISILPSDAAYGAAGAVSVVRIMDNRLSTYGRGGITHQNNAELLVICRNYFLGSSGGQEVDLEPTGSGSGVRRAIITQNQMVKSTGAVSLSLSGINGTWPHEQSIISENQLFGSNMGGLHLKNCLISRNQIFNVNSADPSLNLRGDIIGVIVDTNHLERSVGASAGGCFTLTGANSLYPRGVQVRGNMMHQYVSTGGAPIAILQTADDTHFNANEIRSFYASAIAYGLQVSSSPLKAVAGIDASGNWIYGDSGGSTITVGVGFDAKTLNIDGITLGGGEMRGCSNLYEFAKDSGGAYSSTPAMYPIRGAGNTFAAGSITALGKPILVSGGPGYNAQYVGAGAPTFTAAKGSTYTRDDGASGSLCYVNTSSGATGTTWTAYA